MNKPILIRGYYSPKTSEWLTVDAFFYDRKRCIPYTTRASMMKTLYDHGYHLVACDVHGCFFFELNQREQYK